MSIACAQLHAAALQGTTWQRCRVHFMRNVLAKVTAPRDPTELRVCHSLHKRYLLPDP